MRRLVLFAIGLVCLAVVTAITFAIFNKADPTPTPPSSQRPAATARPTEAAQPLTGQAATLLAAFEKTSALTSLEADVGISMSPPSDPNSASNDDMATQALLTISKDGVQQYAESSPGDISIPGSYEAMDMIVIGATGYVSSTILSKDGVSVPGSGTTEPAAGWEIMPPKQAAALSEPAMWSSLLARMLDPEHDLPLLILEGHEELNGIACDRYFTDQAAMPWAEGMQNAVMSFTQQDLTVWHCADGNIRRIESAAAVGNPKYPESTYSGTMSMELIATSTTRVITAPANARPLKR